MRVSGHGGFSRVGGGGKEFQSYNKETAENMAKENQFTHKRESVKEIKELFNKVAKTKDAIVINDDGDVVVKKSITKGAEELAEKLANRIEYVDREVKDAYEDLRSKTKGTYRVDPKGEIDEFRKYQKNSLVNVVKGETYKDSKDGHYKKARGVDSLYDELYNEGKNRWALKSPKELTTDAEKLNALNNTLRDLRSRSTYDIYSDRARYETGQTPSEVKRQIKDELITNAYTAQELFKPSRGGRKKK